jgi:hypothetical protein
MNGETIARGLGLHRSGIGKWDGKCPCCGYRTGFAVTERRDGLPLVYCHAGGCSQSDLIVALRRAGLWPESAEESVGRRPRRQRRQAVGGTNQPAQTSEPTISPHNMVRALWRRTTAVQGPFIPPIVVDYLRVARGYTGTIPTVLRQLQAAKHPSGTFTPAMVALVQHADGGPVAVHRTFLRADGSGKADLDPNKMTLGPSKGAAVQLAPVGAVLAIAEGIESALSYMQATGVPTWAALSAVGIRNLILPPDVAEVIIAADPDPVGVMAARAAARRWLDEGRRVSIARPPIGFDFNDLARRAVA